MKLTQQFERKKVKIVLFDNSIITGTVGDYIYPENTEENIASIILDNCEQFKYPVEIQENEIRQIEML